MSRDGKEKSKYLVFLEIVILIVLIIIALKLRIVVINSTGYDAIYKVPLFVLPLLLIGYIIWELFGDQISAPIASFLLQSGERISKPKNYSRARALLAQNKIEEAIKVYERLINKDKFDITAYCELADIYHEKLKDYSAAFNCYEKIEQYARENTDIIFAINRKVDIYLSNKDYPGAIKELKKITQKFPKIKDSARAEERIKKLQHLINSAT
ncbi:MAG: tetratricopeptide repeat protein [Candidatus Ratteibacteria bacterium]|nr:tetratricopeptide repeat protein [Candidatus Ratteibacteria bacterium]